MRTDGAKEVLGLWIEQTEGAKFWLRVMTELRGRGIEDILITVVDGLKGFPEAITTAFPDATVQTCIVHLIRHSMNFCSWKDRKAVAADLRPIYEAPTAEEAAQVERKTGIRVPSRAALSEVESSSRLRRNRDGLSLSTPMVTFDRSDFSLKPLGFLLNADHLVTVRFHDMRAIAAVRKRVDERDGDGSTSTGMFLLVVEELVKLVLRLRMRSRTVPTPTAPAVVVPA